MKRPLWRLTEVRLVLVGAFFLLAWAGVGYRLLVVQGLDGAQFAQRGFDQRVRQEEIAAPRGTIFDRDGVELAVTVQARSLVADPRAVADPAETAELLAPLVGANYVDLVERLNGEGQFAYMARHLETAEAVDVQGVIEESELEGLYFVGEPKRVYPAGPLAAHVIGFVRVDDNVGLEGLEMVLDSVLSGTSGSRIAERDPAGRAIPQGRFVVEPAQPGADVILTIDREIQFAAEQALETAMMRTRAAGGSVVVLSPRSGEILAMASAPSFDPNERAQLDPAVARNRAVTDTYEPGSTLKVITFAAALEEGLVRPGTTLEVPQTLEVASKEYVDIGRHPTVMTVADIVARSSNVGTILIQQMLGNDRHFAYLDAFGLGDLAASDVAGELPGRLYDVSEWCHSTCGPSTAIGYRVDVTALQMAAVFATIANDGEWVQPHVVAEIVEGDGAKTVSDPERRRVLSEPTALPLRRLLRGVVEQGTGWRAAVDGFTVGGKTGTTEKFIPEAKKYSVTDRIASFIGFAPTDKPEIVVAVVLDTPNGELDDGTDLRFGGAAAAPVFAEVAEAALHHLGVSPDLPGVEDA